MKNQMTRDLLVDSIKMDDELYHHGILGMSWGDRHGPPYPLSGSAKKIARAEAKKKIERERRLKKARKAAAKKRKETEKTAKKQSEIAKKKNELLQKGDMNEIYKNRDLFTTEELENAVGRHRAIEGARAADSNTNLNKVMGIVAQASAIATAAVPIVTIAEGIYSIQKMNVQQDVDELKRRDTVLNNKIAMISAFSPEAGLKELNRAYGTKYTYDEDQWKDTGSKIITQMIIQANKGDSGGGKKK